MSASWRFFSQELDAWCDGVPRALIPGRDLPAEVDFQTVRKRLQVAARRRMASARVWQEPDGTIHFVMLSTWVTGARPVNAPEEP